MSQDTDTARAQLHALDRRLRELVAVAGSPNGNLEPVWKDCEEIGRGIADIALSARGATAEDKLVLVDEMSSLCEFYAIAIEYLQREKSSVAALLQQMHKAKDGLAFYGRETDLGESCDIAG